MNQKEFKEWYLHYFGLHSVAVAGCIMYSPYVAQAVFTIIHLVCFIVATIMHSCARGKASSVVYNIMVVVMVLLDICLLFSLTMGVGASGYDYNAKNCYLLQ